ncbi:MAG: signal recognition particle protein [Chitinophagales bacterium]|tara:strand:- start:808 stop:2139 length:1332 start_codon:yes stop_codon:yes gene_type:complete
MFQNLQEKLEGAFKSLKGQGAITELNVATTIKEIRRALVDADVNYKIAKEFTDKVKEEALGQNVLTAVSPGQLMTKIVKDQLTELMGGEAAEFSLDSSPAVILIAGLQGSGKTTFTHKLAHYLKDKQKKRPMMVAGDVYRPAAIDQLKTLGESIGIPVYAEEENKQPVEIAKNAIEYAKANNYDVVIVDTAGRLAVDEQMMDEIAAVKLAVNPDETLFVVDAMTGQDAVNTAEAFNKKIDFDGVVLTKLDGDTRGGAALTIKYTVNKPIKFVSTGEKVDTLDVFHPDRMAQRILGMGDIISFVERAQHQFDEKKSKELERKIAKNEFDFNDFLQQLNQIKKMGNIKDLLGMIPGMGKAMKDIDISDDAFNKVEAIIHSMTPAERAQPELMNGNRRKRLADGSGNSIQEVNQFLKQFEEMRKMMKKMQKSGAAGKMMKGFGMGK